MADRATIESPAVKWTARAVLASLLVAAAWWLQRATPTTPEDVIRKWFEGAARGDVGVVQSLCAEPLRSQLASGAHQSGPALSAMALRSSMAGVKGLAIQTLDLAPDRGAFLVELVRADRNERHRIEMVRWRGQWRIARVESDAPVIPPVRYGTPAYEE